LEELEDNNKKNNEHDEEKKEEVLSDQYDSPESLVQQ